MGYVKILQENTTGRDFITSDLHGYSEPLETFISWVKAGKNDRIFICGDILDKRYEARSDNKNPYLYFVDYIKGVNARHKAGQDVPGIISTMGNHEAMFLCWYAKNYLHKDAFEMVKLKEYFGEEKFDSLAAAYTIEANGGKWALTLASQQQGQTELKKIFDFLLPLPLIIRVDGALPFNIVHADLPVAYSEDWRKPNFKMSPDDVYHAIWAREANSDFPTRELAGNGTTYCGHSPDGRVRIDSDGERIINLDMQSFGNYTSGGACFVEHFSKNNAKTYHGVCLVRNGKCACDGGRCDSKQIKIFDAFRETVVFRELRELNNAICSSTNSGCNDEYKDKTTKVAEVSEHVALSNFVDITLNTDPFTDDGNNFESDDDDTPIATSSDDDDEKSKSDFEDNSDVKGSQLPYVGGSGDKASAPQSISKNRVLHINGNSYTMFSTALGTVAVNNADGHVIPYCSVTHHH